MAACAELPIQSVRVYPHPEQDWYALFIASPGYPNGLKLRFSEVISTLRKSYALEKSPSRLNDYGRRVQPAPANEAWPIKRAAKTAEELASLIKTELGESVIVISNATVGWTAKVTGAPAKSLILQLTADVIAARLRQRFNLKERR